MSYKFTVWVLFGLFALATTAYLHRVPGLMGDEGSEGENVYELLDKKVITIVGERSYIGPLIDYVRVPFIKVFGYTSLGLRLPIWLATLATFWLAERVAKRLFGRRVALLMIAAGLFSPAFLLESRLGWTITLFPFFALLIIWLLLSDWRYKWLLAGLAAGLGLANHILFLPILVGIVTGSIVHLLPDLFRQPRQTLKVMLSVWPSFFGFWAGFGMQFVVLNLSKDDQGDPQAVAQLFTDRLASLPTAWWQYLSGSVFVANYTGKDMNQGIAISIALVISLFILIAVILSRHKRAVWSWTTGLLVGLIVLLYIIDRHNLRYFAWLTTGAWFLTGAGLGEIATRLHLRWRRLVALILAGGLTIWMIVSVLLPFLKTGGSTNDFVLVDRIQSADALVDVRPLVACLKGQGKVFSENIHIFNRLQYLSHSVPELQVAPSINETKWIVFYRKLTDNKTCPPADRQKELCPDLNHFCVMPSFRLIGASPS